MTPTAIESDRLDAAAWAVCPSLRFELHGEHRRCERCPAVVETPFGVGTRYCRWQADKAARAVLYAVAVYGDGK